MERWNGAKELDDLLEKNLSLFAGGEASQEAGDTFFEAVMTAYVTGKRGSPEEIWPEEY